MRALQCTKKKKKNGGLQSTSLVVIKHHTYWWGLFCGTVMKNEKPQILLNNYRVLLGEKYLLHSSQSNYSFHYTVLEIKQLHCLSWGDQLNEILCVIKRNWWPFGIPPREYPQSTTVEWNVQCARWRWWLVQWFPQLCIVSTIRSVNV